MIHFYSEAGKKKLLKSGETLPMGFEFFKWDANYTGGVLMKGGVPRLLKSGSRKGQKTWRDANVLSVIVTDEEANIERCTHEETHRTCNECIGEGKKLTGWNHITGARYKRCSRCGGTGLPPKNNKGYNELELQNNQKEKRSH